MSVPKLSPALVRRAWPGAWLVTIDGVDLGRVERLAVSGKFRAYVNRELAPNGLRLDQLNIGDFATRREAVAELRIQFGYDAKAKEPAR